DMSDAATLVGIVAEAGLDPARAREILGSDEFAAEVRADEALFQRSGIRGVPAIIFERQHLVSGGQPVEVFERALREIAAGRTSGH
ncbi:MAG TPA: DsbA family protein, partial [Dokdonella sp.]